MEDILDVYKRQYDPECHLVCLDEAMKQLIIEKRVPIPMEEGKPVRFDYEYERNGTGRGRDGHYWPPPAQIPTCSTPA